MIIPFGEWLPDLPDLSNPGALIAKNVIGLAGDNYGPLRSPVSFTDALASACLGSFWVQDKADQVYNFAGDSTSLYSLNGSTWNSLTNGFTATNWEFVKYGQRVIAAAPNTQPQFFDMDAPGVFAPLPNAPAASRICIVRGHVMLGDLTDEPEVLAWSGLENSETYSPSLTTQAGRQNLFGRGGRIQRLVPGNGYAVVFQEHSIRIAQHVGPPILFNVGDELERGRGTPAPNSVCWTGQNIFYYGQDGFYVFNGGSNPIGANRVDDWFRRNSAAEALPSMRGAVDRHNRLVLWAYKSTTSALINDRLIIYNWAADKWSYAEVDTETIAEYLTAGVTMEQADAIYGNDADAINVLSDSDAFAGGRLSLALFGAGHTLQTLSGAPLEGEIGTKELGEERRMTVRSVRPLVDSGGSQVCVGRRDRLRDQFSFSPPIDQNDQGECDYLSNARYHRFTVKTQGDWTTAQGVDVEARQAGRR